VAFVILPAVLETPLVILTAVLETPLVILTAVLETACELGVVSTATEELD